MPCEPIYSLSPRRFATYNIGKNIQRNSVEASDGRMIVPKCRKRYPNHTNPKLDGIDATSGLSLCTVNALTMLIRHDTDIAGLQEVDDSEKLQKHAPGYTVVQTGGGGAMFRSNYDYEVLDPVHKVAGLRCCCSVYFPVYRLLFVSIWLDHTHSGGRKKEVLEALSLRDVVGSRKIERVIWTMDSNDDRGTLLKASINNPVCGQVSTRVCTDKLKTCCEDTNYRYAGDYIFDTHASTCQCMGIMSQVVEGEEQIMSDHMAVYTSCTSYAVRVVISTHINGEKVFLVPGQQDHDSSKVVGIVTTGTDPYRWIVKGDVIYTSDEASVWDAYDGFANNAQIMLYSTASGHANQSFPIAQLTGDGGRTGLQSGRLVVKTKRPTSWDVEIVKDGWERTIELRRQGGGSGIFKYPIYFATSAKLSSRQVSPCPVLIMERADFLRAKRTVHDGAFGEDYDRVKVDALPGVDHMHREWMALWKFPSDLSDLDGFEPIKDVALPVGTYPFTDDNWFEPKTRYVDPFFPESTSATKYRCDSQNIHWLRSLDSGPGHVDVAMIGSSYFINDLWGASSAEQSHVRSMIQQLYDVHISAFACYSQHHAIVLYFDIYQKVRITPSHLAMLLKSERGDRIRDIMKEVAKYPHTIDAWSTRYIKKHQLSQ